MSKALDATRVVIVPMHPGHQYHFCRVGLPTYFLGNWDQFMYWRPKPPNVHNLLDSFENSHSDYTWDDYAALLDGGTSIDVERDFDMAWLIFGWQYELFRHRPIPKAYHATKIDEISEATWADMFERDDFAVAAIYPSTAEWVKRRFGVEIPYIPIGLDPEEYAGHTGSNGKILSVIHSWAERGWHYDLYREACEGLPTLHVDHLDTRQRSYRYDELLQVFRESRVYLHDGEREYTIALIEALMAGLPIVSFDLPGISRYVRHGVNGFIGRTPTEIREHCRRLLHDDALAAEMGASSRALALEGYTEERWTRDWRALIGQFLGRSSGGEGRTRRGESRSEDGEPDPREPSPKELLGRLGDSLRKKLSKVREEDPNIYPLF